jgi:hypothetical protein
MTAPSDDDGVFEPFADGVTASSSPPNEGSNVCRAAALAFLLRGAATAVDGLTTELRALGFPTSFSKTTPATGRVKIHLTDWATTRSGPTPTSTSHGCAAGPS